MQLLKLKQQQFQLTSKYYSCMESPNLNLVYDKLNILGCNIEYANVQGFRQTNEDEMSITTDNENILTVIFDGHGGDWVSNYCSNYYHKILYNTEEYKNKDYEKALIKTNKILDQQLYNESILNIKGFIKTDITNYLFKHRIDDAKYHKQEFHHSSECGSTCLSVLITKDKIYCSNIGDSRAMLFEDENSIVMNEEHSLNNEMERIVKSGYTITNNRLGGSINVVRGFGDFIFKNPYDEPMNQGVLNIPDITIYDRKPNQKIILGCDGLWNGIKDESFNELIDNQNLKILTKMAALKSYDNVSIITIDL